MSFANLPPRDQLVDIMLRIYRMGMTTLSGGNLSIRDDDGSLWITPAATDKGRINRGDIIRVWPDDRSEGPHRPSSELPFHRAIYAARPDLRAIVHAHPPALVSYSVARKLPDTAITATVHRTCGSAGYAPYALTGTALLGERIAATFAAGHDSVLLENHGAVAAGISLLDAFQRFEMLEFAARTQINAHRLGTPRTLAGGALTPAPLPVLPETPAIPPSTHQRELAVELAAMLRRAYDRGLMLGAAGAASVRVDEGAFLINPAGVDRSHVAAEDLVLVRSGQREAGKQPVPEAALHAAIYAAHPDVHCIMNAHSPHMLAYALVDTPFDSRIIPESYILLRQVPRIAQAAFYGDPAGVAAQVSLRQPLAIVENDSVLALGESLLKTYDRLEVAEYGARSLIDVLAIGELIPMDAEAVRDLEAAFKLA